MGVWSFGGGNKNLKGILLREMVSDHLPIGETLYILL